MVIYKQVYRGGKMITGVGTDIISTERIRAVILRRKDRFLNRIFTPAERRYCKDKKFPWIHFAGRFAAKESVFKVLQTRLSIGVRWKEVEILPGENKQPQVSLKGKTKRIARELGIVRIHLSISHDKNYAVAIAVGEKSG